MMGVPLDPGMFCLFYGLGSSVPPFEVGALQSAAVKADFLARFPKVPAHAISHSAATLVGIPMAGGPDLLLVEIRRDFR